MANLIYTNYASDTASLTTNVPPEDLLHSAPMDENIRTFYNLIDRKATIVEYAPVIETFKRSATLRFFMANPTNPAVIQIVDNFMTHHFRQYTYSDFSSRLAGICMSGIDFTKTRINNVHAVKVSLNPLASIPKTLYMTTIIQRRRTLRENYENKQLVKIKTQIKKNVSPHVSMNIDLNEDLLNTTCSGLYLLEDVNALGHEKNGYTMMRYFSKEHVGEII